MEDKKEKDATPKTNILLNETPQSAEKNPESPKTISTTTVKKEDNTGENTRSTQNSPVAKNVSKETSKPEAVCAAGQEQKKKQPRPLGSLKSAERDELGVKSLPITNNPLYNVSLVTEKLKEYPTLKIRSEGKYYVSNKSVVIEKHPKVLRNKQGQLIPIIRKEKLGPLETIFMKFCEEVLCISRAPILRLSSQGERHLIWVGRTKAKHILKFLKGNGCFILNRFPGDIFLKDKQVMAVTLSQYMLEYKNTCFWKCGINKDPYSIEDEEDEKREVTYKICTHMVSAMKTNQGCTDRECSNYQKSLCKHLDIFIPEMQSFCSYNALQEFSNRLDADLKDQLFICKPSYLYKGLGFRFFREGSEFKEFYHMTIGKETSRHDFLVQRVVDKPYLFKNRKIDIRSFLLIVTLRYRRVVAFVNPGFCRVAAVDYSDDKNEADMNEDAEPLTPKKKFQKLAESLREDMARLVCTYQTDEERADRIKRMAENRLFSDNEDRSKELDEVFRSESLLNKIKRQIKHIATRLASDIERRVWDAFGCYQIFGLDFCLDENYKVWLIEVNSHAISEFDVLSPTQRIVVPAAIMEALGLVVECMYKSTNDLRLRKSPYDEFEETGFLFGQNYEMVFNTLKRRRTNYVHPRRKHESGPPFYERITEVDEMIEKTAWKKNAHDALKKKLDAERSLRKKRRAAKEEEES